jgi:pyridoxine/pyridoxamine 5'-phosphate oxidase
MTSDEESDLQFAKYTRGQQLGFWSSDMSAVAASRSEIEKAY